jgi:ATP-binding cassette subfamily B protein
MGKDLTFHSNRMSGGIVSDNNKLNSSIERFWDTIIFTAVPIVTTIISVCTVLAFIYWQFAVALIIVSLTVFFVIVKAQSWLSPRSRATADRSSAMTAYFADVVSNISAVKTFAGEAYETRQYAGRITAWNGALRRERRGVLLVTGAMGTMMMTMNILAFAAAVVATQYHLASVGTIYLVISYTVNVVGQLWSVSNLTRSYIRIIGDAGPMIETLDDAPRLTDPPSPKPLVVTRGEITFDAVTFAHDQNQSALFKDFSLTIEPGQKVGLVGVSGSGKTSLTRLLLRLSDVDDGHILIDDTAIDAVTQADLRRAIAYVPQEPVLFHRSLRENIAYGNPDASESEIRRATRQAHALEFIDTLPEGFDTLVGERGIKLSGGQRQRIAIARAILKNAPILVLDEATSALDSESEKLIQDALEKLMQKRTSIIIAHRLSTIAKLDRIIVMADGAIIEDGSHTELLKKRGGMYAKLWKHQSGGFIEE